MKYLFSFTIYGVVGMTALSSEAAIWLSRERLIASSLHRGPVLAAATSSTITNPSFETNPKQNDPIPGWTLTGDTDLWDSLSGITPAQGTRQAFMSTDETSFAVDAAILESALQYTSGILATTGGGTTGQGSGVFQSITIGTGDVGKYLNFNWNLLRDNAFLPSTTEKDYAFVSWDGSVTKLADIKSSLLHLDNANTAFPMETGYQTFSIALSSSGTHKLAFGVMDILGTGADDTISAALLVDNITITSAPAVPEPWQWTLVSAGALAGFAFWRRLKLASGTTAK